MSNKVAIITGGSSGIGSSIVKQYCDAGYLVYSTYHKSKKAVKQLLSTYPDNLTFYEIDLANEDSIREFFTKITSEQDHIDVLINNAGVVYPSSFSDLSLESWQDTFSVNVYAPFLCIKYAMPLLDSSDIASIINIASMRGLEGCGGIDVIDYSASKSALINLTQTLAKMFSKITINAIAPGFVATENYKQLPQELQESAMLNTSIKRFVNMTEIAELCYYLSSSSARAITGTILPVDGGYSLVKP